MRIVLERTACPRDMIERRCCVCDRPFQVGCVTAIAMSESGKIEIGQVCPDCLERGANWIEERIVRRHETDLMLHERAVRDCRQIISEYLSECPTAQEFRMLERLTRTPRYRSGDEAQAAIERGEWPPDY